MDALEYIGAKFSLDLSQKSPILIERINRQIMAETLNELGAKRGVEIGTAEGTHAEILCRAIPGLDLYCVDPWVHYPGYTDYMGATLDRFYKTAVEKLAPYHVTLLRKFSLDAAGCFPDNSLDFVYIDGAHDFQNVADDICTWIEKVKPGGVFFGHDYKRSHNPGFRCHVVDVVGAYTYAMGVHPWFILGQQGTSDGLYREGTRSWMWVKPC